MPGRSTSGSSPRSGSIASSGCGGSQSTSPSWVSSASRSAPPIPEAASARSSPPTRTWCGWEGPISRSSGCSSKPSRGSSTRMAPPGAEASPFGRGRSGPALPLRFRPILKEKVWGGRRLESLLGKVLPGSGPYGESWEVADCDGDRSLVDGGPWDGLDLHALVAAHPEAVLGRRGAEFPLLLKTIDASDWLSVQLHPAGAPGEVGARDGGPAPRKKTEAWIILDAPPGARIIYGLADGVERERFFDTALSGAGERIQTLLGWREVRAGDVVFLPPGTIHAIGPGILLLEVQE